MSILDMRCNPSFTPPMSPKWNETLLKALTQNNLSKASEYPFTLHTFGRSPRSNDAHFLPNGTRSRYTPSSGGCSRTNTRDAIEYRKRKSELECVYEYR
ncbi:hypothetical protein NPIL_704801 [Nephila pilipes]|uniref:Uncharacterized protein n=1 Tax=Nephila pilipes TaxID=299642 RepID=A0A8X6I7D4_NEPPI|nr:hypothetical protein NPIL_704801 [Nephila pilipes]